MNGGAQPCKLINTKIWKWNVGEESRQPERGDLLLLQLRDVDAQTDHNKPWADFCSGPSQGCLFCSDSNPRIVSQLFKLHTRHMGQSGNLIDSSWLMGPGDEPLGLLSWRSLVAVKKCF